MFLVSRNRSVPIPRVCVLRSDVLLSSLFDYFGFDFLTQHRRKLEWQIVQYSVWEFLFQIFGASFGFPRIQLIDDGVLG